MQIKADVTGRPVRRVLGDCATSAGAAMLAGVAAGDFDDLEAAVAAFVAPEPAPAFPMRARPPSTRTTGVPCV